MIFKGDFFLGHPVEGVPNCTMQWKAKFWNYAKSAFCSDYSETGHCLDGRKSKVIDQFDRRETNKNKCAVGAQADKGCQPCFNNWHHPKTLRKRGNICLQVDSFILSDLPQVTCVRSLTGQL